MATAEVIEAIRDIKLQNLDSIKEELLTSFLCKDQSKDILIVIKDQLPYVKRCIESIQACTENYTLYLWDNASEQETKDYLESLKDVVLIRSEENLGFIKPNNRLAELTASTYLILLNSDTEVKPGWDRMMLGWLQTHPTILEVGYCGSKLNEEFKGGPAAFGYDIDYVTGWCMCIHRDTYDEFGLFDEKNLRLAYCEDADFSLRIKEAGFQVYALHADLVLHYENKTISQVNRCELARQKFAEAFQANHCYVKRRWS